MQQTKEFHEDEEIRINNARCAVIVFKGDQVLVIHRRKNGREYSVFPGGHMRKGEKPIETAERELGEETTIKVKNLQSAFDFADHYNNNFDNYFIAEWKSGEPTLAGEEMVRSSVDNWFEPGWVDKKEISSLDILPIFAKEWLINYLQKKS
jgi:8-oxo-dGTP diphosphatase